MFFNKFIFWFSNVLFRIQMIYFFKVESEIELQLE